jgi:methionyl-tRNA formyltransferase
MFNTTGIRSKLDSMNLLLIAEGAAGIRTLQLLRQMNHCIVAIMTSFSVDSAASMWSSAAELGYETWSSKLVRDPSFANRVRDHKVDMILNVHSLVVMCRDVLEAPILGSYNLHPGPLPRYAGLNSVCWAIYRGERTHGVTLHRIEPKIDSGPIACQETVEIGREETGLSLTMKCIAVGVPMLGQFLEAISRNPSDIRQVPQNLSKREYFGRGVPENGELSWERTAQQVFDFVRACDFLPFQSPWGHPLTTLRDCELGILKARLTGRPATASPGTVGEVSDLGAEIACADEWILVRHLLRFGKRVPAFTLLQPGDQLQRRAV